ncbi:MAG TPA: hypothetical protein V6D08_21175 [Candidatus Obscuribacterales bacterium]
MSANRLNDEFRGKFKLIKNKVIRRHCNNPVGCQCSLREIAFVPGNYQTGFTFDGGCQHVAVIWIWKGKSVESVLIAFDKRVKNMGIH